MVQTGDIDWHRWTSRFQLNIGIQSVMNRFDTDHSLNRKVRYRQLWTGTVFERPA